MIPADSKGNPPRLSIRRSGLGREGPSTLVPTPFGLSAGPRGWESVPMSLPAGASGPETEVESRPSPRPAPQTRKTRGRPPDPPWAPCGPAKLYLLRPGEPLELEGATSRTPPWKDAAPPATGPWGPPPCTAPARPRSDNDEGGDGALGPRTLLRGRLRLGPHAAPSPPLSAARAPVDSGGPCGEGGVAGPRRAASAEGEGVHCGRGCAAIGRRAGARCQAGGGGGDRVSLGSRGAPMSLALGARGGAGAVADAS